MKIVIAGTGKVGRTVAAVLSEEENDVTVIDLDPETVSQVSNDLDVICVEGNAADPEALRGAGVGAADLVVAATEKDEVNMVCGIASRKLGAKHVIARIRDPLYLHQVSFLRDAMGLSQIINPEYECATEISRILRFPGTLFPKAVSRSLSIESRKRVRWTASCCGISARASAHGSWLPWWSGKETP